MALRSNGNHDLIRSTANYARSYLGYVTGVNRSRAFQANLVQSFNLQKETLQKIIQIFFDSELDAGRWSDKYTINSCSISGTIHGRFYHFPANNIQNCTDILLNIYAAIFSARRTNEDRDRYNAAATFLNNKFFDNARINGGSGQNPYDLAESLRDRLIHANDLLKLTYNVTYDDVGRPDETIHQMIINDNYNNVIEPFEANEISIEDILRIRFANDPLLAREDLMYIDDGLRQLRNYYNRPEDLARPDSDNESIGNELMRPRFHNRAIRIPVRYNRIYNLRQRERVNYRPFLSRTNQSRRRRRIGRGLADEWILTYLRRIHSAFRQWQLP